MLIACAHGTRHPTGRRLIAELALTARELRPGLVTTAAFVDVQPPTVVDVVAGLAAEGRPAVVVPRAQAALVVRIVPSPSRMAVRAGSALSTARTSEDSAARSSSRVRRSCTSRKNRTSSSSTG